MSFAKHFHHPKFNPVTDSVGPSAPSDQRQRRALRLMHRMYEDRGETRVTFIDEYLIIAWTDVDDQEISHGWPELEVTDIDEMIEFWTDYLLCYLDETELSEWMEDATNDDDPT